MAVSDRLRVCSNQGRLIVPFFFGFFLRMKNCFDSPPVAKQNEKIADADGAIAVEIGRLQGKGRIVKSAVPTESGWPQLSPCDRMAYGITIRPCQTGISELSTLHLA